MNPTEILTPWKCLTCSITSYTEEQKKFNFPQGPQTLICRFCLNRAKMCKNWVYIDEKLKTLEIYPRTFHFTIENEAMIRNLISLGDTVYTSDGERLWRWGSQNSIDWKCFNRVFGSWYRLHPVGTVLLATTKGEV